MHTSFKQGLDLVLPSSKNGQHVYVAYSGGLDSQVLLDLTAAYADKNSLKITALHVNYGFSEHADRWQEFCMEQCKARSVPIKILKAGLEKGASDLERKARDVRYTWFESFMSPSSILLSGHHLNDQSETVIMRLMRGSGTRGLAAIPQQRALGEGRLIRPLLNYNRGDLSAYAKQEHLAWLDDESNREERFDRNFVRHTVLPTLQKRWPESTKQLAKVASHCAEEKQLLDDLAALDLENLSLDDAASILDIRSPLEIEAFLKLSQARQRNVLGFALHQLSTYPPARERLRECLVQIQNHSNERDTQFNFQNLKLALYDGRLHFLTPIDESKQVERMWQPAKPIKLPSINCVLKLRVKSKPHQGKRVDEISNRIIISGDTKLSVHWRKGGERVCREGESFSRSLKQLYQQERVAPWLRSAMPLVSLDDEIIWSAALGTLSNTLFDTHGNAIEITIEAG